MVVPLWFFLIPYLILIAGIILLAMVNLWHLLAFSHDLIAFITAIIAILGFIAIGLVSWQAILNIDWMAEIDLVRLIPFL